MTSHPTPTETPTCLACGKPYRGRELQCDACRGGEAAAKPQRRKRAAAPDTDPFPAMCEAAGLPRPEAEVRFDPKRKWRFDYGWAEAKVALEVEGGAWLPGGGRHNRAKGFVADMDKYTKAALAGWAVLRVTPAALYTAETFDMVRRALSGRTAAA